MSNLDLAIDELYGHLSDAANIANLLGLKDLAGEIRALRSRAPGNEQELKEELELRKPR